MGNPLEVIWGGLQRHLFPLLAQECGPLSEQDRRFIQVLAVLPLERLLVRYGYCGKGRPPQSRRSLALAFLAKAVYGLPSTRALIDALTGRPTLRRLCGYDGCYLLPQESTFSRAFAEFAAGELPQALHAALINQYVTPRLVGHVSRDATAIQAREQPRAVAAAAAAPAPKPRKLGRPRKGEVRPPLPPKRLEVQLGRSLAENLADLPRQCDWGRKRNSQGNLEIWKGYKLHLDVVDGDLPVSAILTAASLHDSQAAIPLAQQTDERVTALYELMDSAYDAAPIRQISRRFGRVAIIEPNPRSGERVPLAPAEQQRLAQRSAAERVNAQLKDCYGGRWVRVRGAAKVMAHLMFGLLALTAVQLLRQLVI